MDETKRERIRVAHGRRLAGLDPLLPQVPPLEPAEADTLLEASAEGGEVVGWARLAEAAADTAKALWGALRTHRLTAHVAGSGPTAAFDRLLSVWESHLEEWAHADDEDTAAAVTIASHDVALARPLALRGFTPITVVAVRTARASDASAAEDPRVRPARPDDLDALTDLVVALHDEDARFGGVSARASAPALLRASVGGQLGASAPWTWVTEDDGGLTGLLQVQPPDAAGWIAPVVAASPVAYLGYAYVAPSVRATGLGAALVAAAHREAARTGVAAILLHHALPSPTSTPFWYRQRYRPLWTVWQRRPALRSPAGRGEQA